MTKKIAVINDLSGFGRCSLTAAISVISVMGVQPCPLPTAILSGQTGYPHYYCDSYTDKMPLIRSEWEKMDVHFDGICTGFLADERQVKQIQMFLDSFLKEDTFLLVDPVLGGDGKPHGLFTEGLLEKMRELCRKADIITPNLTELCLLTGASYEELGTVRNIPLLMEVLSELARSLLHGRLREVLITGIHYTDENGIPMMGNLDVTAQRSHPDPLSLHRRQLLRHRRSLRRLHRSRHGQGRHCDGLGAAGRRIYQPGSL